MAANREPRRIARQTWETNTHLGEIDADLDELHSMRLRDNEQHKADMKRLESKLDKLIWTAWAAAISGATMGFGLVGNIILKTL